MKRKSPELILKVKKIANKNEAVKVIFHYGYELLKSAYFKAFINIAFTVIFAFQVAISDFNTLKAYQLEFYAEKWHILITTVFMLVFNWLSILVDTYQKREQEKALCLKEIIARQTLINHNVGIKLFELINNVCTPVSYIPTKSDFNILTYQDVATLVCHNIYDAIKNSTGNEMHQVSLMQKFKDKETGKEYIKMIAYGNANQMSPGVFNTKFFLEDKEKFCHVKIFAENSSSFCILKDRSEIEIKFTGNKKNESGNAKIEQYIGIPVFCAETGVVSLLQIDADVEFLFGRTNEEIEEFFRPFVSYLHILTVNYYLDELFRLFSKKYDILNKKIEELKEKGRRSHNYEKRPEPENNRTRSVNED